MGLKLDKLRCEYRNNPLGIDVQKPRLSWIIQSDRRGTMQQAYHIQVALSKADLEKESKLVWDTGEVKKDCSIQVEYDGEHLESFRRYWWRVKVWDNHGEDTGWSEPAWWEMGILRPSEWKADWISPDFDEKFEDNPSPMLRKEFNLTKKVRSARAYATALGLYEIEINGSRVGDALFTPGFTSYHKNLQYQVFEVTDHLKEGPNAVGVCLADGWYRGRMWIKDRPNNFGKELAFLAQIHVEYEDGSKEVIVSDDSWQVTTGPVLNSNLFYGEEYDARLEIPGWSSPDCQYEQWKNVKKIEYKNDHLVCSPCGPGKIMKEIKPENIFKTPKGELIVDLGQNISGNIRLEVEGKRGLQLTLSYTEELDPDGNFVIDQYDMLGFQKKKKSYYQVDKYILKGGGPEVFEPRFKFSGFKYVKVEGYPGNLDADKITGLVIYSDLPDTGDFSCSSRDITKLHHNIVWSQKGNFLEIPTDCPQREKMGWTGDIQIYAPTACYLMDSAGFLTKWLRDLKVDQLENGLIPHIIPWLPDYPVFGVLGVGGSAGWGDACIIVPWTLYQYYGDKKILEETYDTMKKWIGFIQSRAKNYIWTKGMHWGDWLEPGKKTYYYFLPWSPKGYVATPFFANSAHMLSKIALILGKDKDADKYKKLSEKVNAAYLKKYVKKNGRIRPSRQGAYVLALTYNMVPKKMMPKLAAHLAQAVRDKDYHLDTGFLSTPHLCQVLCDNGYEDLAFKILNQDTIPSWLYEVKKGATTIWEAWDAKTPDNKLQKGMSFNHYAFGAVGEWLYRYVAGIGMDVAQPGFKHIVFSPHPGGGLTQAQAIHQSPYGQIRSAWQISKQQMTYKITVPPNSTATVHLPNARLEDVRESGNVLSNADAIDDVSVTEGCVVMRTGSGSYEFCYPYGC